jgi:hypothetical protein
MLPGECASANPNHIPDGTYSFSGAPQSQTANESVSDLQANNLQQSWRFDWEPPKAVLRDVWTIDWILGC